MAYMQPDNFQHILRVMNTNIDGKTKCPFALTKIKGVGRRFSTLVLKKAEVNLNKRAGEMTPEELEKFIVITSNPRQFKIPDWFLNRKKDHKDGRYSQLTANLVDMKFREGKDKMAAWLQRRRREERPPRRGRGTVGSGLGECVCRSWLCESLVSLVEHRAALMTAVFNTDLCMWPYPMHPMYTQTLRGSRRSATTAASGTTGSCVCVVRRPRPPAAAAAPSACPRGSHKRSHRHPSTFFLVRRISLLLRCVSPCSRIVVVREEGGVCNFTRFLLKTVFSK